MRLMIKTGIIVLILGFFVSCNIFENNTSSSARLLILSITGEDLEGQSGSTTVFSDVLEGGGIFNDTATAELQAVPMDPYDTSDSYYRNVVVDQIDIRYTRSDGMNREGLDVPFAFTQTQNQMIALRDSINLPFVLIQHNAKMESPLIELVGYGQEKILKLEVHVTFYSKDLAGKRLAPVTGKISVWCSNFADN